MTGKRNLGFCQGEFMVEKKQMLYDLRMMYNGPFVMEDFYAEVENWIKERGFEKEPKRKTERVSKDGKRVEWVVEAHHHLDDLHYGIVVLRVMFNNLKEVVVKRDGKKMRVNSGDAYISIDGFIQSHIHGSFFQVKPIYYFIKTLIDKFVYQFWSFKYDAAVNGDCHELFKRIRSFFNVQKYKCQ